MAPGWVRTEMGGADARLGIEESIPGVVRTLDGAAGPAGPALRRLPGPDGALVNDPVTQAWALMRQLVDAHNRHAELAEALGFRLGAGRGKVLLQLRDGPSTLSEIAAAHRFDAPYATLVVDKLESHGLVERAPHPDDRRRKLVTLTAAGHDAVASVDAILLRPPPALETLSVDELRQLTGLLDRVARADEQARPASGAPT